MHFKGLVLFKYKFSKTVIVVNKLHECISIEQSFPI